MHNIRKYLLNYYEDYLTDIYQSVKEIETYKIDKVNEIKIKLLKNQKGGNIIEKMKIDNVNYYVNEKKYKTDEYGYKQIYFYEISEKIIKKQLNGENIEGKKSNDNICCGILQINEKEKIANIHSLGNYENCVICINNDKYKVGDIILKIMIEKCKHDKIIKISLKDNSMINCKNLNNKIKLSLFRTMTKGFPYYLKYGFYPQNDYDIVKIKNNMEVFEKNPKITLKKFMGIYNKDIVDNTPNTEFSLSYFVDELFNSSSCNIVEENYERIFDLVGYKNVYGITYCLNLEFEYINNFIDTNYKQCASFIKLDKFIANLNNKYNYDFNFDLIIKILENKNIKIFAGKIFGLDEK